MKRLLCLVVFHLSGVSLPAQDWTAPEPGKLLKDQPLDLKKLHLDTINLEAARSALEAERDKADKEFDQLSFDVSDENAKLRLKLAELLGKVCQRQKLAPIPPVFPDTPSIPPTQVQPPVPAPPAQVIDPVALGQVLFQRGEFADALNAFKQVDQTQLKLEQRMPLRYMIACCLRRLGKFDEAAREFREIANSPPTPFLAECAQWQLAALRRQRELEGTMLQFHERLRMIESRPEIQE